MNKQDFLNIGGKEWTKEGIERVYLSAEIFNILQGTSLSDNTNKFFFDCKSNALMRSYKSKKPQVVAQYE